MNNSNQNLKNELNQNDYQRDVNTEYIDTYTEYMNNRKKYIKCYILFVVSLLNLAAVIGVGAYYFCMWIKDRDTLVTTALFFGIPFLINLFFSFDLYSKMKRNKGIDKEAFVVAVLLIICEVYGAIILFTFTEYIFNCGLSLCTNDAESVVSALNEEYALYKEKGMEIDKEVYDRLLAGEDFWEYDWGDDPFINDAVANSNYGSVKEMRYKMQIKNYKFKVQLIDGVFYYSFSYLGRFNKWENQGDSIITNH